MRLAPVQYFSPQRLKRRAQQGFVLVATLFAIALITLAAAFFASRVDQLRSSAFETQGWAEAEREAFSTREALMFQLATNLRNERGVTVDNMPLVADGRAYPLSPTLTFYAQDERGLLPINVLDDPVLSRFLGSVGIPVERHARFIDTLRDYIDPDSLKRLNGAETQEYAALGRAPPANDYLRTRDEIPAILAWDELFAALDREGSPNASAQFLALFTTGRHSGVNVNTAPPEVLLAIAGLDPTRIGALVDQRQIKAFQSMGELAPFSNGSIDDEFATLVGANTWRITHYKAGMPFLLECQLSITAGGRDKPVSVSGCRRRALALQEKRVPGYFSRILGRTFTGVGGVSILQQQAETSLLKSTAARTVNTNANLTNTLSSSPSSFSTRQTSDRNLDDIDAASTLPWLSRALRPQSGRR